MTAGIFIASEVVKTPGKPGIFPHAAVEQLAGCSRVVNSIFNFVFCQEKSFQQ